MNGGSQHGTTLTTPAVGVTNGLFTVTLDFGGQFNGSTLWLDISVRTNSASSFTPVAPRQLVTPVPYAITAEALDTMLPASQLSGPVANSQLGNSSVTVTAGAGLSGGGTVSLGSATTLNNTGVLSVTGNPDITATTVNGAVALHLASNSVTVKAGTGLSGGSTVALGGTTTLNNAGVLSVNGNSDITATTVNGVVTLGDTATSANTANSIVKRDTSGNFAGGTAVLSAVNLGPASGLNTTALNVYGDDSSSYADAKQILIQGSTTPSQQLELGYKTSGNYGVVQAIQQGVGYKTLALNPLGGTVGVGTALPRSTLDVAGSVSAFGLVRLGREDFGATPLYPSNPDSSVGLIIRRIASNGTSSGSVVGRTDLLQLERDGTSSGLQLAYQACSHQTVNAFGFTASGSLVTCIKTINSPSAAGTLIIFSDSQRVVHYDISFGNAYTHGHTCHLVVDRYDDGTTIDFVLVGTVTSTYNQ